MENMQFTDDDKETEDTNNQQNSQLVLEEKEFHLAYGRNKEKFQFLLYRTNNTILIICKNYEIILTMDELSDMSQKIFDSFHHAFEYIVNRFKENKVLIKNIIINKLILLRIKKDYYRLKDFDLKLLYTRQKQQITKKINENIEQSVDPKNFKKLYQIKKNTLSNGWDNAFIAFQALNEKIYIIYYIVATNIIECFDLIEKQLISTIKYAHTDCISNFRYYTYNKKEYILSLSSRIHFIKVWDFQNWNCISKITVFKKPYLQSACFITDNLDNNVYIIASNTATNENILVYDFEGNIIKEIEESNDKSYIVDTYEDNNKQYIIVGNNKNIKSFDYEKRILYHTYTDTNLNYEHLGFKIIYNQNILKLMAAGNKYFKIWDFHTGNLIANLKFRADVYSLCLFNDNFAFIGCDENIIRLVDIQNVKVIKEIVGPTDRICNMKMIVHPLYGECMITQGWKYGGINFWVSKLDENDN